jgi:hypothetical protein
LIWKLRPFGTIHWRHRHSLGGKGSKIDQICRQIVVKKLQAEEGRDQKSWKFANVLKMDGPFGFLPAIQPQSAAAQQKFHSATNIFLQLGNVDCHAECSVIGWKVFYKAKISDILLFPERKPNELDLQGHHSQFWQTSPTEWQPHQQCAATAAVSFYSEKSRQGLGLGDLPAVAALA